MSYSSAAMNLLSFSIKQSMNSAGIRSAFLALKTPQLIMPQIVVNNLSELNFADLYKAGITCIVFDKVFYDKFSFLSDVFHLIISICTV